MMRISIVLASGALILSFVGCASQAVIPMTGVAYDPKPADCAYEVFGDEDDVQRPFAVTCVIDSKTGTTVFHRHSAKAALDHISPKICECGGDAIIVMGTDKEGALSTWGAGWGKSTVKVKVVRYTDQ